MFIMKNLYLVWIALGVLIITQLLLTCIESCRRSFPLNIFLYYLMVLSMSYTLAVITLQYDLQVIYFSVIATFVLCLSIAFVSLFFGVSYEIRKSYIIFSSVFVALQIDFTGYMGFYMIAGLVLIICSTIVLIVSLFYQSMLMQVIYSFIVVFIIGMYFGYELQMIFGGGRYEMDPNDYVVGAVVLYIDIIMLFIHLLRIIGFFRDN
jgi:protein lifeguard